jgi:hypothetical protein
MSRLVSRNPFARHELHVTRVHSPNEGCTECGNMRIVTQNGKTWLYQFWTETDEGKKYLDEKLFCSRECRAIYLYGSYDKHSYQYGMEY